MTQHMHNGHFRQYNVAGHYNGRKTRDSERRHFKFVTLLEVGKPECKNAKIIMQNIPQKGRGLGHVTPKISGIQSNISSKLLQVETSNLVHSFILGVGKAERVHK